VLFRSEDIVWKNAEFCQKAGITTLLLDAGYNNTLNGGISQNPGLFNDQTGDWAAEPTKFPDFRGLVERLHKQGQKVTVWVALFMAGKATRAYQHVRGMLMRDASGKEGIDLCPRKSRHSTLPGAHFS